LDKTNGSLFTGLKQHQLKWYPSRTTINLALTLEELLDIGWKLAEHSYISSWSQSRSLIEAISAIFGYQKAKKHGIRWNLKFRNVFYAGYSAKRNAEGM